MFVFRIAGFAIFLVMFALAFSDQGNATTPTKAEFYKLNDVSSGQLMLKTTRPGYYLPAPTVATDIKTQVTGTIARTTITQRFRNPSNSWVEGVYAFPLFDMAAVDQLLMIIGDRIIVGKIKEKQEARKIYETAKGEGRKASLVEQLRPNMFTNEVANIGPNEEVIIQIEYQESVSIIDGKWSLRFPTVIGTRLNPDNLTEDNGRHIHSFDRVPDRAKIPAITTYEPHHNHDLTWTLTLAGKLDLAQLETPFHRTDVEHKSNGNCVVTLADGKTTANRDIEVIWSHRQGSEPRIQLFNEDVDISSYHLLMLTPQQMQAAQVLSRDLTLIIDTSGSMSGTSIEQARHSAHQALARLSDTDKINIVAFSTSYRKLFDRPQILTPEIRRQATAFIQGLRSDGGTNMFPAVESVLMAGNGDIERLHQIVFLTDGAIGNEAELFNLIDRELGKARLFTVGIGSAPNSYFMSRAAEMGRGAFTHIGNLNQVGARMARLFKMLESPAMTDIELTWPAGTTVEATPNTIADLYAGETIVVATKGAPRSGIVTLKGMVDGEAWQRSLKLETAQTGKGIGKLWARSKIADIEAERIRKAGFAPTSEAYIKAKDDIVALALEHQLVSPHTSLVAVDTTASRTTGEKLSRRNIPLMVPAGWTMFETATTPLPAMDPALQAMLVNNPPIASVQLPQTATPMVFLFTIGLVLLLLAFGLHSLGRKSTVRAR